MPAQRPVRQLEPLDSRARRTGAVEGREVIEQVVAAQRVVERDAARQVAIVSRIGDAVARDVVAEHRRCPLVGWR